MIARIDEVHCASLQFQHEVITILKVSFINIQDVGGFVYIILTLLESQYS